MLYRSISPSLLSDVCAEGDELKLITLYVPETYLKALDQLVGERFYPNRAEVIRVAIRDLINDELWRRIRVG
jgi:Arc/MetJ-type ribon-helix-helix transcriptional regulator